MDEIFLDVFGYEGLYKVSNKGNVFSIIRNKILKQEKVKSKNQFYARVSLSKSGVVTRIFVHRLVAFAFIKNYENKPQVNHIDHNPLNNCVDNLEWVTGKENMRHSTNAGRQKYAQQRATETAAIVNRERRMMYYSKFLGESINGRTLLEIYNKESKSGRKYIFGKFSCDSCGDFVHASLESILRLRDRHKPLWCKSCANTKKSH